MSSPITYATGHVKRNTTTGEIAVRTIFPEDQGLQLANMAWLVSTTNVGARNAPSSEVASWSDLYTPPTS